jgi:hypothetical protein
MRRRPQLGERARMQLVVEIKTLRVVPGKEHAVARKNDDDFAL